jgi:signal transduction histidine kinase
MQPEPGVGSDAARAELVRALAHEIRGPVSTIKGLAVTLRTHDAALEPAQRVEFATMIEREADRLGEAVDQVALAMRLDVGDLSIRRRPESVGSMLADAVAAPADVVGRGPAVSVEGDPTAELDRTWFVEVVRQLVTNAVRFSPADAPVEVAGRVEGSDLVVEVTDRGPGIPPDRLSEVTGRFVTWRPAGFEDVAGTGLGLSIVTRLLALQGGDASLEPNPAGGTIARVRVRGAIPPSREA